MCKPELPLTASKISVIAPGNNLQNVSCGVLYSEETWTEAEKVVGKLQNKVVMKMEQIKKVR